MKHPIATFYSTTMKMYVEQTENLFNVLKYVRPSLKLHNVMIRKGYPSLHLAAISASARVLSQRKPATCDSLAYLS